MYQLYTWYGWEFGKWCFRGEFQTLSDVAKFLKGKTLYTIYVIQKDGKILKQHYTNKALRVGMVSPHINKNGNFVIN